MGPKNFLLTSYIYPLKESIVLSEELNISLDNARTAEEFEAIYRLIDVSNNSPDEVYTSLGGFGHRIMVDEELIYPDILSLKSSVENFKKNYSHLDPQVSKFFEDNLDDDAVTVLSKMWVVLRYDDEGAIRDVIDHHREMADNSPNEKYFLMISDDNPIEKNSQEAVNYTYLLSLLIHSEPFEDYYGRSFILHHSANDVNEPKVDTSLNYAILMFGFMSFSSDISHEQDQWKSFYHIKEQIIETAKRLDVILDEKFAYISSVLKSVSHDIKDDKQKLVGLTSLIELLLTHSPDYNRFNVEESISKQFKLKLGVILYMYDKKTNLEYIKNRLRDIYAQRSNIAHGNFGSLHKYIKKIENQLREADSDEVYVLEGIISELYYFLRAIISISMRDTHLVDYIKKN